MESAHEEKLKEVRSAFLQLLESKEWRQVQRVVAKRSGLEVEIFNQKPAGSPVNAYLGRARLPIAHYSAASFQRLWCDLEGRREWDAASLKLDQCRVVETLREGPAEVKVEVTVTPNVLGGLVSSRGFVMLRTTEVSEDGSVMTFGESVEWPGVKVDGVVMGYNHPSGMRAVVDGDGVELWMLWHTELKGWLSYSMVDKAMPPSAITCIDNFAVAMREENAK